MLDGNVKWDVRNHHIGWPMIVISFVCCNGTAGGILRDSTLFGTKCMQASSSSSSSCFYFLFMVLLDFITLFILFQLDA